MFNRSTLTAIVEIGREQIKQSMSTSDTNFRLYLLNIYLQCFSPSKTSTDGFYWIVLYGTGWSRMWRLVIFQEKKVCKAIDLFTVDYDHICVVWKDWHIISLQWPSNAPPTQTDYILNSRRLYSVLMTVSITLHLYMLLLSDVEVSRRMGLHWSQTHAIKM